MNSKHNLVIVESPAKGRTIERYLGSGFKVLASFGHVRDLPEKELGIDLEKNYEPHYVVPAGSRKIIAQLRSELKDVQGLYLATDLDREGEAIAWHILEALDVKGRTALSVHRITFNEITRSAIQTALKHPREINPNLVNSQQARRVLDRLVGYSLSPFLWKKVYRGLSAGRVQSVAVRLVVERERAIEAFKPQEYWSVEAELSPSTPSTPSTALGINALGTSAFRVNKGQGARGKGQEEHFRAQLIAHQGTRIEKLSIGTEKEARDLETQLKDATYAVTSVETRQEKRYPLSPFTTSTMTQEASNRLRYSAKRTMRLAQDLYEAGLITYMRTDSVAISSQAQRQIRAYIATRFGANYLPPTAPRYTTKTRHAQEAHESIHPTKIENLPDGIALGPDHRKLYELIWRRTVASQMNPAVLSLTGVGIKAGDFGFRATGTAVVFEGAWKVWPRGEEKQPTLPNLKEGDTLLLHRLHTEQHFTEPLPRYTEATLVKSLEERGIGRPSTYAPILSTIQERGYVRLEERKFHPQDVGMLVTDLLVEHFPKVMDYAFTATIEDQLDQVAEGAKEWRKTIDDFYRPFASNLREKEKTVEKKTIVETLERKCPESAHPLVIRMGRYGKFISCSGFPKCRYAEPLLEKIGMQCPQCGTGEVIERRTKKGKRFWGCSRYPKCTWASWTKPENVAGNQSQVGKRRQR